MRRAYSSKISLTKNARGVYSLDPSIGCTSGMENEVGGCFGDCYAAKSAKLYGYDFRKTVIRNFENEHHRRFIVNQINRIPLDFVRMGTSGDPSENWNHTIDICHAIDKCNKEIVIITKHWTILTEVHLRYLATINVCVNTSVSALDKTEVLDRALGEYERMKPYCKSILRIVSCDFNLNNSEGYRLARVQSELFKNESTLDTILRVGPHNKLVKKGIINVKQSTFLGKKTLISRHNKNTYFGKCSSCHEMCGLNIKSDGRLYPSKPGVVVQLGLFKNGKLRAD